MSLPGVHYALLQEGTTDAAAYGIGIGMWIFILAMVVVTIAAWWRMFEKAGKPGWAAIVPIYNMVVLCQVAGRPGWWVLLMLIPLVNIIIWIIVSIGVANNFGKGALFGLGLFFIGIIFYPILGFGDAQYQPRTS
jgi:uncharacterized membrane protein YhaH (DUF805 family)